MDFPTPGADGLPPSLDQLNLQNQTPANLALREAGLGEGDRAPALNTP